MSTEIDYESMRASTGQRLGAVFLDLIFFYIFSFLLGTLLGLAGMAQAIESINVYLFGIILMLLYYVPQEATSGRTLGKRIVGTCAISMDGGRIAPLQGVGRTLCRLIPFDAFSFFGGNGRPWGWHDKLSNTQVVVFRKLAVDRGGALRDETA